MATALQNLIDAYIKRNANQEITGPVLNGVLTAISNALGTPFIGSDGYWYTYDAETGQFVKTDTPAQGETGPVGVTSAAASIDDQIGTPSVAVSLNGTRLDFAFSNLKGQKGDTGDAGITAAIVTVDSGIGTPSVDASITGTTLTLAFHNLKGETGAAAGFGTIEATVDDTTGTPAVVVTESGPDTAKNLSFAFSGLKGEKGDQGDTGVSADYPITIANNLTTDDPTAALAASQGVVLKGEIDQLGQEINGGGYAVITTMPGPSLSSCGGTIKSSDNTWLASTGYYGALIPVIDYRGIGCIIKKNTNGNHIDYAFLTAGYSSGRAASFATGYSAVVRSESDVRTTVPSDAVYLYVYMASPGAVYTPSEVQIIDTSSEVVGLSTRVDNIEEVDSLQSRFLRCLAPKKLRLCTYNIGHFSGGSSKNSSITASDYEAKLLLYKNTIRQISADIIGVCEYSRIFGTNPDNEQVLAEDVLLQSFIPSLIGSQYNYSCNALFSKTIVEDPQEEDYQCNQTAVITHTTLIEAKDYYYIEADLYMHGELVKLVITHLAFDNNYPGVLQGDQINELITKYSTFDKVIMMGDWNVANFSEFNAFTNAGYSLANDGTFLTYPSGGRALDNIIVKGLTISNPGMITTQGQSDHYPFYCDVQLG